MIDNKIPNKIIGVSKISETVLNEHNKKIHKQLHMSLEKRQEIVENLKLK